MNRAGAHPGRVVIVAYYFPPLAGVASERVAALSRHLGAVGWEPLVITPRDGFYHRANEAPELEVPVLRTRSLELSRVFRGIYAGSSPGASSAGPVRPVDVGMLGSRARGVLRDFVYVPDAQVGWIPFAAGAAARALGRARGKAVLYSTSVPFSAHLAAMAAAKRCGFPWIAEFRDPWSSSIAPSRSQRPIRQRLDRRLERQVVLHADHLVVTSESTRADLLDIHHGLQPDRISVVTNGFEPRPERPTPARDRPMTILYAGTVAPGEDVSGVLASLDQLYLRRPGSFTLRVLGPPEPWESPGVVVSDRPWLELSGMESAERAREAMAEASALLFLQCHLAYRRVLPGKLFEYIGARRPIVAVCPPQTEMAALLGRYADARMVDCDVGEDAVDAFERLVDEHQAGSLQQPRVPVSVTEPLQRAEQAAQLAALFDRLTFSAA